MTKQDHNWVREYFFLFFIACFSNGQDNYWISAYIASGYKFKRVRPDPSNEYPVTRLIPS